MMALREDREPKKQKKYCAPVRPRAVGVNMGQEKTYLRSGLRCAGTAVLHLAVFALVYERMGTGVATAAVPHNDVGVGLDHLPRVCACSWCGHCRDLAWGSVPRYG